jgi:hypothetical protein
MAVTVGGKLTDVLTWWFPAPQALQSKLTQPTPPIGSQVLLPPQSESLEQDEPSWLHFPDPPQA